LVWSGNTYDCRGPRGDTLARVSDDDVRLVLGVLEAVNRRDIEAVLSAHSPDAQMATLTSAFVQGRGYEGHAGIRDYFSSLVDVWDDLTLSADEATDLDGHVLVRGRWRSRGKGSGAEVESPAAWLFTVTGGKIVESQAFRDTEDALAELDRPPVMPHRGP
jgi:ketosteroid isomerase-like protein